MNVRRLTTISSMIAWQHHQINAALGNREATAPVTVGDTLHICKIAMAAW